MVPFNQGSQSALQTSTTLPLLLLLILLLLIYFFHFTGEEPEAQKEKVICCRSYNEKTTRGKIRIQFWDFWILKDHFLRGRLHVICRYSYPCSSLVQDGAQLSSTFPSERTAREHRRSSSRVRVNAEFHISFIPDSHASALASSGGPNYCK